MTSSKHAFPPVCQPTYRCPSSNGTTASSERHEVLSYPSSAIDTVYATLAGDVDGVPSSLIKMGTWRTGYIRR